MNYKIAVDARGGGSNLGNVGNGIVEKEYTLLIAEYINNRLNEIGLESTLVRSGDQNLTDKQRVDRIKNTFGSGSDVIVISNELGKGSEGGSEIRYALRNNATLARTIASELENEGVMVNKYYQLRLPSDTSKDSDYIIRETPDNQSLVISYGSVDNEMDANTIKNNWMDYAEAVVRAIADYTNTPYDVVAGDIYIVQSGDSLWSIANKFNTTVDELKRINNLSTSLLQVGQKLKVSGDALEEESSYTVVKGDSLWAIAKKFGVTVDEIKNLNNLKSDSLSIGQKLKIPGVVAEGSYTVVKGDSLWTIAQKFGVTVTEIKSLNNLTSDSLSIGQVLKIPSMTSYKTYTVKRGDSLWTIARDNNTTVDEIKSLNNLVTDLLQIGQVLKIPS